jgi:hypothetical protein
MKIKHLRNDDGTVTAIVALQPAWRRVVEFSSRASTGFARG